MMDRMPTPEELVRKIKNPNIAENIANENKKGHEPDGKVVLEIEPEEFFDTPRKIVLCDFNDIFLFWRECGFNKDEIHAHHTTICDFISSTMLEMSMSYCVRTLTFDDDIGTAVTFRLKESQTTNIDDSVIDALCYNIHHLMESSKYFGGER